MTRPLLLEPATSALGGVGPDISGIGALNGLLEAIKLIGEVALPFVPTTAQRELTAKWPEITKPLAEHPDQGVLLVRRSWLPAINMNDYGDTSSRAAGPQAYFRDWQWQHGPTPADAYAWYSPPGSALSALGPYGELPVEDYFWVDSSGKWTPYPPPSMQTQWSVPTQSPLR